MYKILYHPNVTSVDIPKLDKVIKLRIKKTIEKKFSYQPEVFGIPLRGDLAGYAKIRVGDYRILFRIEKVKKILKIFLIEHRSVAYKLILKRI